MIHNEDCTCYSPTPRRVHCDTFRPTSVLEWRDRPT